MMNPPRQEAKVAIESVKQRNKTVMITRNHKITATAIAKRTWNIQKMMMRQLPRAEFKKM